MTKPTCEDTYVTRFRNLRNDYFSLGLAPFSRAQDCRPGQFLHIKLPCTDVLFRRAFSIAGISSSRREIEVIFKRVGRGTSLMAGLRKGDTVNVAGPLGKPFGAPRKGERVVLVAGGVGFPPLLYFATRLVEIGHPPKQIDFFYGGRTSADVIERTRIRKLGLRFHAVTEDGSLGIKGLVTEPLREALEAQGDTGPRLFACGPEGMLKAVNDLALSLGVSGQVSLEAPMPCGIGVCLGCVVPLTTGGHARVCCDGPVFDIGEVEL